MEGRERRGSSGGKGQTGFDFEDSGKNVGGVKEADILKGEWLTLDCPIPSLSPPL